MVQAQDRTRKYIDDLLKERDRFTSGQPVGPRTYEVNINADPAHLLDWDKALKDQPIAGQIPSRWLDETRKEAQSRYYGATTNARADQLLGMAKDPFNAPGEFLIRSRKTYEAPEISRSLNEAGIPGIKYLDEGSRISSPGQIDLIRQNIAQREALLAKNPGNPTDVKWLAEYQDMLRRAENPTRNYVIFDPARIRIDKKYGIAGAAAPLGALAATDAYQPRGD
jgi:hypothetical protein